MRNRTFENNNLDLAASAYLQQHKDNPICWQEWSCEVLEYARASNKIILVSSGYATCHWCHVMAGEVFSNSTIARFLNQHFVCIKVDREERPDIDHYLMSFMQETQGHGGWPLNVFLSSEGHPFFSCTYLPPFGNGRQIGFFELIMSIVDDKEKMKGVKPFVVKPATAISSQQSLDVKQVAVLIQNAFVESFAGFSDGPQFPHYNTILYLLFDFERTGDRKSRHIVETILDRMMISGLCDHLQGGFFRYCVDESWTIPHFEKMLYDQAMHLWVYSIASRLLNTKRYEFIVKKLMICMEQTFLGSEGLYYSAHDADTDHYEGATYLWDREELRDILGEDGLTRLGELYTLSHQYEGKIHLVKRMVDTTPGACVEEDLLLTVRRKRLQPFCDYKFITSWNALLGVAFVHVYRALGDESARIKAKHLFAKILAQHSYEGRLAHCSSKGILLQGEFLEDYACLLLFATYLYEDGLAEIDIVRKLNDSLLSFRNEDGSWRESKVHDFDSLVAQEFDHPMPASSSVALFALVRAGYVLDNLDNNDTTRFVGRFYKPPLSFDFYNLAVSCMEGEWHCITTPRAIAWKSLPHFCLQLRGSRVQDCYHKTCNVYQSPLELLNALNSVKLKR